MALDPSLAAVTDFEQLPLAGGVIALDGTILAVNAVATMLASRPAAELVGHKMWEFAPGAEHIWPDIAEGALRGQYFAGITLATPEGPRAIRYVAAARTVEGRSVVIMLAYGVDAMPPGDHPSFEALGAVAGGIAHEFNNQLVSVLGEATAACERKDVPDDLRDALRRIAGAGERMAHLTSRLLAYAGKSRLVAKILDPDDLVNGLRQALQGIVRPEAVLSVQTNAGHVSVRADHGMLQDVVVHLVSNASDALPPAGGTIEISTSIVATESFTWWRLEVSDNGGGMDAAVVARMFDPFFTTKVGRQGLGLSAVQGIVRQHGGDVSVDSEPGKGTRVRVRLPVVADTRQPASRPRTYSQNQVSLRGLTILVADDEQTVRTTVRRLFERRGATVVIAADGDEAAALLVQGSYALVVLDVMMPKRTGYQLLPVVRAAQPDAKIMLMSGFSDARSMAAADEPDAFLEKPFTAKQMDDAVDRVLGR